MIYIYIVNIGEYKFIINILILRAEQDSCKNSHLVYFSPAIERNFDLYLPRNHYFSICLNLNR